MRFRLHLLLCIKAAAQGGFPRYARSLRNLYHRQFGLSTIPDRVLRRAEAGVSEPNPTIPLRPSGRPGYVPGSAPAASAALRGHIEHKQRQGDCTNGKFADFKPSIFSGITLRTFR